MIHAVEKLPAPIEAEHGPAVEARLVTEAARFDPETLAKLARRIGDLLDPDGTLADDAEHDRRRTATLVANRDGSGELCAHLTPGALAQWQAVLDPLAAPRPSDADGPDTRTPGQRMHDALADTAQRLLASGTLPVAGGTPATVLVTMTLDQLETRTGLVTTSRGGAVSVADALRIAGEATVVPVVIDREGVLGTDGLAASPPQPSATHSRPVTAAAAFPDATPSQAGRRRITSSNGSTVERPTSTISVCCADITIANSSDAAGR